MWKIVHKNLSLIVSFNLNYVAICAAVTLAESLLVQAYLHVVHINFKRRQSY